MKENARDILAENIERLMRYHGIPSQSELARRSKVSQPHIGRILRRDSGATIDSMEKIAAAFGLQLWQLLVPDLEPDNPPVYHLTKTERLLYDRLRSAAREITLHEARQEYKVEK